MYIYICTCVYIYIYIGVAWCGVARRGTTRHGTVRHVTARHGITSMHESEIQGMHRKSCRRLCSVSVGEDSATVVIVMSARMMA